MKLMCFFPSKPSSSQTNLIVFYKYLAICFSGKIDRNWRKAAEFSLISLTDLKSKELQAWMKTNSKPFGYKYIHTKSNRPILLGAVFRLVSFAAARITWLRPERLRRRLSSAHSHQLTAETDARLELNIEAACLRNQELHVFGDIKALL